MNCSATRSDRFRRLADSLWRGAAAVLIVVATACGGGGGGGGGGNPVAPPPPPPPGSVSGNLQGSVVGFSNAGRNFGGSVVELIGMGTTTINGDNQWGFQNVPAGVHRLEFRGGNHLTRRVQVRVNATGTNHFDNLSLVEPGPFNLAAYDEIWRSFTIPGTIRWEMRPRRVVLDRSSLGALPQGYDWFERHIRDAYGNWLGNNTNGFFDGTPVVGGAVDPSTPESFDCSDVRDGDVVILGVDECDQQEEYIILGTATHCFDTVDNEVILGAIWFNPCSTEATVDHEIIHTLCSSHLESSPNDSIMGSPGGAERILAVDRLHMRYTYSRPAGVLTPDDAWSLAPLEPTIR